MGCPSVNTMLDWVEGRHADAALGHLSACSHCRDLADALRSSGSTKSGAWLDVLAPAENDEARLALVAGMEIAGRYRLVRPLGEGATGVVWEARSERQVAMKFLKTRHPTHVRRLLREARVVASLRHESIVEMIEVLEDDDTPVIVMELLEGEPLADLLERRGRLEVAETVAIGLGVAAALEAAHERGVVHRDLKPENIFVTNGRVKVLDFGMAKLMKRSSIGSTTSLTRTGALVGTPCYMPPEQLFGDQDVDARADIWALGAILYECLTGKRPVEGEHLGQIFKRIALGDIVPLASLADVPPSLEALVLSMLARERSDRPQSMGAVITRLNTLDRKERHVRRWLLAGVCIAAVAFTTIGAATTSAHVARADSDLIRISIAPAATARTEPPKASEPTARPEPPRRALRPSPPVTSSAPPAEAKPDERLPGGVLKTSPY